MATTFQPQPHKVRRKALALLLTLFAFLPTLHAAAKEKPGSVTMVAYEQNWMDDRASISLKNNTSDTIASVSFTLEYLNMKGVQTDYENFTREVRIDPGMTKTVELPRYAPNSNYYYYATRQYASGTPFKVKFVFKSYTVPSHKIAQSADADAGTKSDSDSFVDRLFNGPFFWVLPLIALSLFALFISSYILIAIISNRRGRNPAIWLLLSVFLSPILVLIILLCLGKPQHPEYP